MNSALNAIFSYITTEKERNAFFLFEFFYLILVCYHYHVDCFFIKTYHTGMVLFKETLVKLLGLPTEEELAVCLAQVDELKAKVVSNEKYLKELSGTFGPIIEEAGSLEDRLLINEAVVEGLNEKLEDVKVEARAAYCAGLDHLTSHFALIRKLKEENLSLLQEIQEFGVSDSDEDLEYDSDLEFSD